MFVNCKSSIRYFKIGNWQLLFRLIVRGFIYLAMVSALSSLAIGQEKPVGIAKTRIDTMTAMGQSLAIVSDMIRGKTPYNAQKATQAIDDIYNYSLDINGQFPDTIESRNAKLSRAKPLIWKDRTGFEQFLKKLQIEAETSAQIAAMNKPTLMRPRVADIIEICTQCHEKFRTPKK